VVSDGAGAGNATGTYAPESSGIRNQEGADWAARDSCASESPSTVEGTPFVEPSQVTGEKATNASGQSSLKL